MPLIPDFLQLFLEFPKGTSEKIPQLERLELRGEKGNCRRVF
jgi:hypothetical protein